MSLLLPRLQEALGTTYRIERELGGGGMSRVFLAEEGRLGRKVVIKVLPPETSLGVHADRFEREIQVAASLQHPHVVPLLTAGATDELLYYVMPFIEGETLASRIARDGALPVSEVVRILRDVVDALVYAHARGVVHRDIKPANILFAGRHALVADFGVAKAVSASSGGNAESLTSLGVALGTPAYMAPEQAAADPNVDHRADLYAVGAVAYELLTGRTPFVAATPQAMLAAHVAVPPDPVNLHRPSIPPEVAALVMRCLEKHPADRWQSAADLLARLEALTTPSGGTTPVATTPTGTVRTSAATAMRRAHPARVTALFALATVAVTALAYAGTRVLGLPDWVWMLALGCMLAGLPVMLYTSRLERRRAQQRGSGVFRYESEPKHQQWFTWRRAMLGGALSIGAMLLLASGYAVSRALGVGPAGTLLSSGRLKDTDHIVLADFVNRTRDSTLGASVSEALRVDLGQSRVVQLLEPGEVQQALARMGRASNAGVDAALAQEVALREGAKAVVTGEIAPLGSGYVLTARVISADSGTTLVPVRETAANDGELIEAVNRLSAKLRERIGESLRSIRASDPLPQVTTGSLAALQLYARGNRAFDLAKYDEARGLLERAVQVDTSFAMAWRKLAAIYNNLGVDQSLRDGAARNAFQHRDRLPPIERHLTAGSYYWRVDRQPDRAIAAYRAVLDINPEEPTALNNLGLMLAAEGRDAEAEAPLRHGLTLAPRPTLYINLHGALVEQRKWAAVDSLIADADARLPNETVADFLRISSAIVRRDARAVDSLAVRILERTDQSNVQREVTFIRAAAAAYRGRIRDVDRAMDEQRKAALQSGSPGRALDFALTPVANDILFRGQPDRALARLGEILSQQPLDSIPPESRPYFFLGDIYTWLERPADVRKMRAGWEASRARESWHPSDRFFWDGYVAMAEQRYRDAAVAFSQAHVESHCSPCGALLSAVAWDKAGEVDSAVTIYERVWDAPVTDDTGEDPVHMPRGLMRLAQLYEQKGNREKALLYYGRFVDRWRGADSELQPLVRDARARMAALTAEPQPRSP